MRQLAGPLALHAGFFSAGYGLLATFGVLRDATLARWAAVGGLAYVCGVIGVVSVTIVLLVAGVPLTMEGTGVVIAMLAAPLVVVLLRARPALRPPPRPSGAEAWIAVSLVGAFALVFLFGLPSVGLRPLDGFDAWNLWARKANLLFWDGELPSALFRGEPYARVHSDYPYLLPTYEALHLRSLGRFDPRAFHLPLWLLLGAFVWAAGLLASRVTRPAVWAPLVTGAAILSIPGLLTAYADVPLAYLLALAALSAGLWIERRMPADLAVAATLLAGCAAMKNEGLVGAAVIVVAAAGALAMARRRREVLLTGVAGAAVLVVAVIPWRVWLAANDLHGDLAVGQSVDPAFLASRLDRLGPSLEALHGQLITRGPLASLVPLALALAALAWRSRRLRPLAGFYVAVGALYFASLAWAYWISPLPLQFHLETSVARVAVGVMFLGLAAVLHLGGTGFLPPAAADGQAGDEVTS
ncbi:MAG: hypothetical protein ACR2H2_13415 [Solirubrobacteraceae bacterium]